MLLPEVFVVVPTLDPVTALKNTQGAMLSSGMFTSVNIVHDKLGEGFTRTVNRGLRALPAHADWVCILNDDIEPMTENWMYRLYKELVDEPSFGLAGPSGPCRTPPQNSGLPGAPYGVKVCSHLAFFCVLIKRDVFDEVGWLDEDLQHYGSDNILSWAAEIAGFKSIWVRHVYVLHEVSVPLEPWFSQDRKMLKRKIGELRRQK